MSDPQLPERIAQFRKMAQDDPDNELGHFRLGQLLLEDGQVDDAARSFQRTLVLSPAFSKVYLLLAQCQAKLGRRDEAVATLREGVKIADQRGDKMPRDDMAKMLTDLGEEAPAAKQARAARSRVKSRASGPDASTAASARRWRRRRFRMRSGSELPRRSVPIAGKTGSRTTASK